MQHQIGEASAQETLALTQLQAIRDRQAALDTKVNALNAEVLAAEVNLAPLQADADRITAAFQAVDARERATQAELDQAQQSLNATAAGLLIAARQDNGYASIQAARPADLTTGQEYLHRVSELRRSLVDRVRRLRDAIDGQRRTVAAEKAQADALAQQAHAARDQIVSLRTQLIPAQADVAQQQAAEQTAVLSIQSRKGELRGASDSIALRIRQHGSGPGAPAPCDARPVPGEITSPFGPRIDPVSGASGFHPGIDFHADLGTPIHACRSGDVIIAGPEGGYGNAAVIDHGGNMATLYAHQWAVAVHEGQHVNAGDVIGYVGSTGYSTGPHLHFEVRLSGVPVNPAPYIT